MKETGLHCMQINLQHAFLVYDFKECMQMRSWGLPVCHCMAWLGLPGREKVLRTPSKRRPMCSRPLRNACWLVGVVTQGRGGSGIQAMTGPWGVLETWAEDQEGNSSEGVWCVWVLH